MHQAWKQDEIVSYGLKVVRIFHVWSNNEHDVDGRRQKEGDQRSGAGCPVVLFLL